MAKQLITAFGLCPTRVRPVGAPGMAWLILVFVGLSAPAAATDQEPFQDCSTCPEMVSVSPGVFWMGADLQEPVSFGLPDVFARREQPKHEVRISKSFAISKYEISLAQFQRFADESGYVTIEGCWIFIGSEWIFDDARSWRNAQLSQTPDHPVTCVNWHDAAAYADWLSAKTGDAYRLPSESEWEYAARAGTETPFWFGASPDDICDFVNLGDLDTQDAFGWHKTASKYEFMDNWQGVPCRDGFATTAPVRSGPANGFGLHHVLGNGMEWVADCWHDDYATGPNTEQPRLASGDCGYRVMRGQGWVGIVAGTRSAFRRKMLATDRRFTFGIRVARNMGTHDNKANNNAKFE